MRVRSSFLIFIIAISMFFSAIPIQQAQAAPAKTSYRDVGTGSSYYPYITYLSDQKVISGYPDGTFRPSYPLTRAEFIALAMKAKNQPLATASAGKRFSDVSSSYWAYNQIDTAVKAGLTSGYPDGTFRPNATITRAEAAALLAKLFAKTIPSIQLPATITDVKADNWAAPYIALGLDSGMFKTTGTDSFSPEAALTREAAAQAFYFFGLLDSPESTELIGKFADVEGKVTVFRQGSLLEVQNSMSCLAGDSITAMKGATATVNYPDGTSFKIMENTKFSITLSQGHTAILKDGSKITVVDKIKTKLVAGMIFGGLSSRHELSGSQGSGTTRKYAGPFAAMPLIASLNGIPDGYFAATGGNGNDWYKQQYAEKVKVEVDMPWGVAGVRGTFWNNTVDSSGSGSTTVLIGSGVVAPAGSSLIGGGTGISTGTPPPSIGTGGTGTLTLGGGTLTGGTGTLGLGGTGGGTLGSPPTTLPGGTGGIGGTTGGAGTVELTPGQSTGGAPGTLPSPPAPLTPAQIQEWNGVQDWVDDTQQGIQEIQQNLEQPGQPLTPPTPDVPGTETDDTGDDTGDTGGDTGGGSGGNPDVKFDNVVITPGNTLAVGQTATINITVRPSTANLTFESKNTAVAGVSASGTVTGLSVGTAVIQVKGQKSGYSSLTQNMTFTVVGVEQQIAFESVTISPEGNLNIGGSAQITAVTSPAGVTLTYASSNPLAATVDGNGLVTAIGGGSATITITAAKDGYANAQYTLPVTVNGPVVLINSASIAPGEILIGQTAQITVVSDPPDAVITYTSDAPAVATVDSSGQVTGVAKGGAVIHITAAKDGYTQAEASVSITVDSTNPEIEFLSYITNPSSTITLGGASYINVSTSPAAVTLDYSSSDPAIAAVDSTGTVRGIAEGSATITVTASLDGYDSSQITIPVTVEKDERNYVQFTSFNISQTSIQHRHLAALTLSTNPADATVSVTSSDNSIVEITQDGATYYLRPHAAGTATITGTASYPGWITASRSISVTSLPPSPPVAYTLSGVAKDMSEATLSGATIEIQADADEDGSDETIGSTTTDASGNFTVSFNLTGDIEEVTILGSYNSGGASGNGWKIFNLSDSPSGIVLTIHVMY